jgi:hypothetical protein
VGDEQEKQTVGDILDEAVQQLAPEGAVVTNYVVVFEYVRADSIDSRSLDVVDSDGMTGWLHDGMLRHALDWDPDEREDGEDEDG